MMSAERLRTLCHALRAGEIDCDDDLVRSIEADVEEYGREERTQLPPRHLAARLPLMGWLIYEATWSALTQISDGRREDDAEVLAAIKARYELIARTKNAALMLPWPEHASRALGALRAQALAESKRDTEDGYLRAQMEHQQARNRHGEYMTYPRRSPDAVDRTEFSLALDEILLQLNLAEAGTACRVAERVIGHWAEEYGSADQTEYAQRMFDQLTNGVDVGEQALAAADRIANGPGFADEVSETRLALPTSFINPGIMTARAVLLMLALSANMDELGRLPLGNDESWDDTRRRLCERFKNAYDYVERPIVNSKGERIEPRDTLKLAIVQTRLSAALLMPGLRLPSSWTFAPFLAHELLDDEAVEAMCAWMTERVTDARGRRKQRSVHRGIGSAVMPSFIDSVEACRVAMGGSAGFRDWRARWYMLDAYAHENGRAERVSAVLGIPLTRQRPI